jgi:uncharacterized protein
MLLTLTLALTLSAQPKPVAISPAPRMVGEYAELAIGASTLRGIIDLPDRPGPWPVVLVHAGSGPTNRDGNGPSIATDNLKMLGRALAAEGIAVLRIDKRGVGSSLFALSREEEASLELYAKDVAAWAALLRKDSRFTKVGYIGHSEGALIGLIAARDAKFDAFVSLCGPGRPLQDLLREQLKKNLPADTYKTCDEIITELAAGRTVKDVPKGVLESLFRPSVQPFLIAAFKIDPAKLVAELKCPVLVVAGSTDIQVSAEDAKRLGEANPKAKVATVKDMDHVLKYSEVAHQVAQLPSYLDATKPLHPKLLIEVGGFLKPTLGAK